MAYIGSKKIQRYFCFFIAAIMPFLAATFYLLLIGENIFTVIPTWNDEANYYHLLESMLDYGLPVGYNGYNGSHAILGTFGFHGVVILIPYYVFCLVFGLNFYTLAICNLLMISISLLLFIGLTKISDINAIILSIVISLNPIMLMYNTTWMIEGINYSLSILLAGLMLNLIAKKNNLILFLTWIVLLFAVLAKITWVVMVFPLAIFTLNKEWNFVKKFIISAAITFILLVVGYTLFYLVSAPYLSSQIQTNLSVLTEHQNFFAGIMTVLVDALRRILETILSPFKESNKLFMVTSAIFWGTYLYLGISIIGFLKGNVKHNCEKRKIYTGELIAFYFMTGYILGIALLYSSGLVAIRTLYPSVVFAICVLCCEPLKENMYLKGNVCFVIIITSIMAYTQKTWEPTRLYFTEQYAEQVKKIRGELSEYMSVGDETKRWDNTVAAYTDKYWMMIPSGMGYNFYTELPETLDLKEAEKYIIVEMENSEPIVEFYTGRKYHMIEHNSSYILLSR